MHLPTLALLLPLTLALAPRAPDNSAKILADLKTLTADIKALNSTLNTFTPHDPVGLIVALQIQQETTKLEDAIKSSTATAKASKKWTSGESESIAEATLNLVPSIHSLLTNLVAHKPAFATAVLGVGDLSATVEKSLVEQKKLTAAFGKAVASKLRKPYSTLAPQVNQQIGEYFAAAIKKFKNCSGLVCLPPTV